MAAATDPQVQNFVDIQIRPICEQIRALEISITNALAQIGDVYAALTEQSPTWTDNRTDGPPHLMTPSDVLAINTLMTDLNTAISGDSQYPIMRKACVRNPLV